MYKALLLSGAAMVSADCFAYEANQTECGIANNCTVVPAFCSRIFNVNTTCDAACTVTQCALTPGMLDGKTCSTCADTCKATTDETKCIGNCYWTAPRCGVTPTPKPPKVCSSTAQDQCVAEAGCFWYSFEATTCGAVTKIGMCNECANSEIRSPLYNTVGMSCTWAAVPPFTQNFNIAYINVVSNTQCAPYASAATTDKAELTAAAKDAKQLTPWATVHATATVDCVKQAERSGAVSLMPLYFSALVVVALA